VTSGALLNTDEKQENMEAVFSVFFAFAVFFRIFPTNAVFLSEFHNQSFY